tara:strand:- start:1707 stop:2102 length:396 start_codon:yes stop_codon:yes gene_type:complete
MNREISNIVIVYSFVIIYYIITLLYRNFYKNELKFKKKVIFYHCNIWCIGHIINYFLLSYLAPNYIIPVFIIGVLFEYFETYLSKINKYIHGNVTRDTIINSIGLLLGFIAYKIYPNEIDLYEYIKNIANH